VITDAALYLAGPEEARGGLARIAGRPLAFRAVMAAVRAGCRRVHVPAVFRGTEVERWIAATPSARAAVTWTTAPPAAPVLLLPASALVEPAALTALLAAGPDRVLTASRGSGAPVGTAARDRAERLWPLLVEARPAGEAVEHALREAGEVRTGWYLRVASPAAARAAEARLYAGLGSPVDTPLDRMVHRRLSRPITRLAVARGITPNQVTLASLVAGLAAVFCLAQATSGLSLAGLALYLLAVVLDHTDGEVARLTLAESRLGEWLDIAVDTLVHSGIVLVAGAITQRLAGQGGLLLGTVAAVGFIGGAVMFKTSPPAGGPGIAGVLDALSNRDGFYVMLLAFVGLQAWAPAGLPILMAVVALGAHAFWLGRLVYVLGRPAAVSRR
jgi:phosphatidylglycerophosphate synthase